MSPGNHCLFWGQKFQGQVKDVYGVKGAIAHRGRSLISKIALLYLMRNYAKFAQTSDCRRFTAFTKISNLHRRTFLLSKYS